MLGIGAVAMAAAPRESRRVGRPTPRSVLGRLSLAAPVSAARAAYEHGYHVTLATDAMTDLDADAHRNSLERIFPRLGETGTTEEVLTLLG